MTENTKKEQSQISMELLQTINIKISNQRNSAHNRIAELEIRISSTNTQYSILKFTEF